MAVLGGWDISELKSCKLPQKAASAFTGATMELTDVAYDPVLYVGSQLVNGTNYCFIALQNLVVHNGKKRLVKLVVHETLDKRYSLLSVDVISL